MKNRPTIKISVIMACHNSSLYLDEAIKSILAQTLGDLELILIDDNSTDNTLEIANRYRSFDSRVFVLSLPIKSGPAAARNEGIRIARGEWIGILDSDDVAMPSRFEEQMRVAKSNRDFVMIGSNTISIDAKGQPIKEHKYPITHKALMKRLTRLRAFPAHSSMVYLADTVKSLSGFNPRYVQSEDYDFWLRLSEIGKLASVDKPLVKIRIHGQNMSYEQDGRLQIRMGISASVCYFLRCQGCPDPSVDDGGHWHDFEAWVYRRLYKENIFAKYKVRSETRAAYLATQKGFINACLVGIRLMNSGHTNSIVWEKVFGSTLPKRLALEWMERLSPMSGG
jgi:glycosyltransferase involved in cell wall biosynthesis